MNNTLRSIHNGQTSISEEDYVALIIGKIIIAWGKIDQWIFSEISGLQQLLAVRLMRQKSDGINFEELQSENIQIDDRLKHRIKQWRRAACKFFGEKSPIISEIDREIQIITKKAKTRHRIAHGNIIVINGKITVFDHRDIKNVEVELRKSFEDLRSFEDLNALPYKTHLKLTVSESIDKIADDRQPISIQELEDFLSSLVDLHERLKIISSKSIAVLFEQTVNRAGP